MEDADPELNRVEAAEPTEAGTEAAGEGVLAEDPVEVEHVRQGLHRSPNVQSGCFVTVNESKNCLKARPNSRGPAQLLYGPAVAVENSGEQRLVSTTVRAHKVRHGGQLPAKRAGSRVVEKLLRTRGMRGGGRQITGSSVWPVGRSNPAEYPLVTCVIGRKLEQGSVLLLGIHRRCQIRGSSLCGGCHTSWGRCSPRPVREHLVLGPGRRNSSW